MLKLTVPVGTAELGDPPVTIALNASAVDSGSVTAINLVLDWAWVAEAAGDESHATATGARTKVATSTTQRRSTRSALVFCAIGEGIPFWKKPKRAARVGASEFIRTSPTLGVVGE